MNIILFHTQQTLRRSDCSFCLPDALLPYYLGRSDTRRPPHLNSVLLTHSLSCSNVLDTLSGPPLFSRLASSFRVCLSVAQTRRRWSPSTWRCVRAWAGPWWWRAGCWGPTRPACCASSGCCPTVCSTPAPSTPRETRRSTPFATWTGMDGGSTPVMSSTRPERGNALSRSQVNMARSSQRCHDITALLLLVY